MNNKDLESWLREYERLYLKKFKFIETPIVQQNNADHDISELEKEATLLKKEDYESMIELALATNDKEWFIELTERMQNVAA
ncbi:hypothetical protein [Cytobacillus sp.]|uniref:hypothetical protein n=1 Tax=Cytobacillus sp. TaxID=2675269 RepID=UPI0028BD63C4|nr:hypothetical protein [Cytobacillus sp.]